MADAILNSVPLTNPYGPLPEGQKRDTFDKQYKVGKKERKLQKLQDRFRQTIGSSAGFSDALNSVLNRRQPINQQLKQAGEDFGTVENPFVRADLMDRAESNIRGSRFNTIQDSVGALQAEAGAQQFGIQSRENSLSRAMSRADEARRFAGNEYLNEINFQRQQQQRAEDRQAQLDLLARQREEAMKQFEDQLMVEKKYGIGNFAPRGGGGGGGGSNLQFKELGDGTFGAFDPNTGQFYSMGSAPRSDPYTSGFYAWKGLRDQANQQSTPITQDDINAYEQFNNNSQSGNITLQLPGVR